MTQPRKLSLSSSEIRRRDLELEDRDLSSTKMATRLKSTFPMTMRRNSLLNSRSSWTSFAKTERPSATLLRKTQKPRKLKTRLSKKGTSLRKRTKRLVLRELLTRFLASKSNKSKISQTLRLKLSESSKRQPLVLL